MSHQAQCEELAVLASIYALNDELLIISHPAEEVQACLHFRVRILDHVIVVFRVHLPTDYPTLAPPVYRLKESFGDPAWLDMDSIRSDLDEELASLFVPESPVLFSWIEHGKDFLSTRLDALRLRNPTIQHWLTTLEQRALRLDEEQEGVGVEPMISADETAAIMDETEKQSPPSPSPPLMTLFHSNTPLIDRKSIFEAHVAPVTSVQQVELVMQQLLQNNRIRRATHNIMAYRIEAEAAGRLSFMIQDYDDDGESAAGARLLKLLELSQCKNVVVVVSRWFGGTLLGPDRFKHICHVARDLLSEHGFIPHHA